MTIKCRLRLKTPQPWHLWKDPDCLYPKTSAALSGYQRYGMEKAGSDGSALHQEGPAESSRHSGTADANRSTPFLMIQI
jgi:hypothetical protein